MDKENLKNWLKRPDVCRCCLSNSGTWDLTSSYSTDSGGNEIFFEILKDCYGIHLSYMAEWGPSRLVCNHCAGQLRDANNFKKQVLDAEDLFVAFVNGIGKKQNSQNDNELTKSKKEVHTNTDMGNNLVPYASQLASEKEDFNFQLNTDLLSAIDPEVKVEDPDAERESSPGSVAAGVSDDYIENSKKSTRTSSRLRRKRLKHTKNKRIDKIQQDTNINEMHVQNGITECLPQMEKCESDSLHFDASKGPYHIKAKILKQVSERKRIRLTCETVLKDTTACPFRHHKSWFQCFYCTQDFMEINQLRLHTLQSHKADDLDNIKRYPRSLQIDITELNCRCCNLCLTDVATMVQHFSDVHNKEVYKECIADYKVDASPYSCHLCGKEFHVFRTLTTHLNEHYANCICDVCGKSFLNSKRLKVHKRTHESGSFPCTECGKVLKTKTSKANHVESAHSKRVIKCQICLKPMKHYNHRIKHMSEEHNITHLFKCPMCPREYNIKHYLATHIRQTHGHKNKKCLECGMAFITNHGLKKHMLKHSGVKAYSCTFCSKSYARSYTLKEHMRGHDNEGFVGVE